MMDIESKATKKAGRFMTILPQILASSAKNMININFGMGLSMPTIIIPVLRGLQIDRNPDETLFFSDEQTSWLGSVAFISQPIGSALSGWISEPIGRKWAMILFNIPHILGWALLGFANSDEMVFAAITLMGLGVGLMEAPIITYIGEISQPSIRGILTACTGVSLMVGSIVVFMIGSITTWRNLALICFAWPFLTMVAISFVPETPTWLLSKKRDAEALLSLQWLRGWVSPKSVENEFNDLKRYSETSNSCVACYKEDIECVHLPADHSGKELSRKGTMRPFVIVIFCFSISQLGGINAIRVYMVQVFKAYAIPMDSNNATVVIGIMQLLGNIVCMCLVKVLGKRRLYFISLTGAMLSCFGLGFYALFVLPAGLSSFDKHEISQLAINQNDYLAMVMFSSLTFFTTVGVSPIPWILLSEVFPFKTRGIISGLAAAFCYIFMFISVKTYLMLEIILRLSGTMFLFGTIHLIGFFCLFFLLPETESRSLEEIELFFSDNKRSMFDRNIKKIVKDIALEPTK